MDKIKDYIVQNYRGILTFISLVCIGCLITFMLTKPPVIPSSVIKTMDSLKTENSVLKIKQSISDYKILGFNGKIDSIGYIVTDYYNKSNLLKLQYDKKINTIDSFSSDDVFHYFTTRYSADTSKTK